MSSYERQEATINDSVLGETTNETLVPYQPHTLQEFVGQVGRLFYDDACIVLLDFLAREQRSFQECDLRDILGWRETLIHQKLYLLNKHLLITQDLGATRGNGRAPVYWRISDHIFSAVQFRYQQVLDRLTKLVEDATNQHEFQCSNPSCSLRHTALDVASCSRSLEDEHPLCLRCGSRLETSDFEETLQSAKEKRSRALAQLKTLRHNLLRIKNMTIPSFSCYAKDATSTVASPSESHQHTNQSKKSSNTNESQLSKKPHVTTNSNNTKLKKKSETLNQLPHSTSQSLDDILSNSLTTSPLDSFQNKSNPCAIQTNESIPWFSDSSHNKDFVLNRENSFNDIEKKEKPYDTFNVTHDKIHPSKRPYNFIVSDMTRQPQNLQDTTQNSLQQPNEPFQFGIKKIKSDLNIKKATSHTTMPSSSLTLDLSCNPILTKPSDTTVLLQSHNSIETVATDTERYSDNLTLEPFGDIEIEIKKLARRVKLSEITEELEQHMTDEEYKIYYAAASELVL